MMLISVEELKKLYPNKFNDFSDELLERKLATVEVAIRQYTHNNFQNRKVRGVFASQSASNELVGMVSPFFKPGDTIQVSESVGNNGLYTIKELTPSSIKVDSSLFDEVHNLVTKIEYPIDLIDGAIGLLTWDLFEKDKVNIASETISRHSVSYVNYNDGNTIFGFPSILFGFCNKYVKART